MFRVDFSTSDGQPVVAVVPLVVDEGGEVMEVGGEPEHLRLHLAQTRPEPDLCVPMPLAIECACCRVVCEGMPLTGEGRRASLSPSHQTSRPFVFTVESWKRPSPWSTSCG